MSEVKRIELGYTPHRFQREIHEKSKRFTVVVAHRRFGKTYLAAALLVHCCLATRKQNARFGFVAPFLKQAKTSAWDYVKRFSAIVPGVQIRENDLQVDYPNGARVRLFGGDNPDAIRGAYFDGVVIDEMADLKPDVWEAVLRPALSDREGWALFIATPRGQNQLYELYTKAQAGELGDNWTALLYRADETGLLPTSELELARADMSDNLYRQEYLCDFTAAADNVLITIDLVADACQRQYTERDLAGAAVVMGVDVARHGDDRSVIQLRKGLWALPPEVHAGRDNMFLANRIAHLGCEKACDACFIDLGGGSGVVDRLREMGTPWPVMGVHFGGRANDPLYHDLRTEMWFMTKLWLERGGRLPSVLELKADLCAPTFSYGSDGRPKLESKEDVKKRLRRSPDCGDALAQTFAAPVTARRGDALVPIKASTAIEADYRPFAQAYAGIGKQRDNRETWSGNGRWQR